MVVPASGNGDPVRKCLRALWLAAWPQIKGHRVISIDLQAGRIVKLSEAAPDCLFELRGAARPEEVVALINAHYGAGTIRLGRTRGVEAR